MPQLNRSAKVLFMALVTILLLFSLDVAQENTNPPQRIILTWEGDPSITQSVVWRTTLPVENPQAEITPQVKHMNEVGESVSTVNAITEIITTADGLTVYHHVARFENLSPGHSYFYRVGDGKSWSEWNVFRTADREPNPFQFIYLGDVQTHILSEWSVLIRQAFVRAPMARFYLYAGDLVNRGKDDSNWDEFFNALGFIPRMIPTVPVPGNHDASREILRSDSSRRIDPLYLAHFALPANGPQVPDLKETAFYLDYQGLRLIAINTNSFKDPVQLQWLERVLQESPASWNIVCHHHPLFSTGNDRDEVDLRQTLMPIYQKYRVDLVLQGHDHRYGRTCKIIDAKPVPHNARAPVYVVSVSGPKAYRHNPNFAHLFQVEAGETQCYQIIGISPEELRYEAWSLDGRLIDAFLLQREGAETMLVNLN